MAALTLPKLNLKTARAWHLKLDFQELFRQPSDEVEGFLRYWSFWTRPSRLEPMTRAVATIRRYWEGMNSLIQAAKSGARDYRITKILITILYLPGAKLNFSLYLKRRGTENIVSCFF